MAQTEFLIRVSERVALPPSVVQSVINIAIDEMGWEEIGAYNKEMKRHQQINEDAGGFILRCIGALLGAKPRDNLLSYKEALTVMVKTAINKKII